jgi:hypothetical protein
MNKKKKEDLIGNDFESIFPNNEIINNDDQEINKNQTSDLKVENCV